MQRTVSFYTLGCKLNFSESSSLSRQMEEAGYRLVPFQQGADVYVINTCSVTDHADKKCRKVVRQAKKFRPDARVAIVGCYAQLKPKEIAEIDGVDLVLGAAEKFNLPQHLNNLTDTTETSVIAGPIDVVKDFLPAYSFQDRTRTFLKVQDGCDYQCAFCTIPLARGKSRSGTIEQVRRQAEDAAANGVKEIVLTGVNIGDFGRREGVLPEDRETFLQLIQTLDELKGIERFRISSIEPNLLSDDIIRFVAGSKRFVPHFHIPLQSGSDKILKAMGRRYKKDLYAHRIQLIRDLMPDAGIGVDVITGFPGESHADFLETYHFLQELDVSYLHVFTYSERPDTRAIKMADPVPGAVRQERTTQLISLSEKKKRAFYQKYSGTMRKVLLEAETDGIWMTGFTDNYIRVRTAFDPLLVNELAWCGLDELLPDTQFECQTPVPVSDESLILNNVSKSV
ncbi:MAG: tRNA (N(6)-L-threonylcarbamoyladenosine(37)-C(2))-methylthiotransferase MtaB [Chitinophagales bacterium]|nr:tRNA (N(6)-L-threonylcarbamoyladenosine(37)-C(2))-methylthiotransferase MtaB [Chitinophagales bacterium]HAE36210.1 tRNA (N(6)-L-threonylcarbamoyladenosine(37)-C(2))-methylthiotransferase MtaB [Bacteroidota bacterium]MCB9019053.1 tRNA (N(6)-L-threonylcarbamoyladenosine(37)-C(2))-methylthiotransferase MtaB [Chitinophagales bacterium]MCB9022456.1 tRNA (N(6)-L-threonylcarbamoyladenosine(37)-C(2))-methylthiotransferase MtaB [Chitinophagales bacterium]HPE97414.1 tRNA (N(6)-L-threonylcarbamoyladeno